MYHYTECVAFRQGKNCIYRQVQICCLRDIAGNIPYISLTMSGFALFEKKRISLLPPGKTRPVLQEGDCLIIIIADEAACFHKEI